MLQAFNIAGEALETLQVEVLTDYVDDEILERGRDNAIYLSTPVRQALTRIESYRLSLVRDGAVTEKDDDAIALRLNRTNSERERARLIRDFVLTPEGGPSELRTLVEALISTRDFEVRAKATLYLAVFSDASKLDRAARLLERIESPCDRALAFLRLARRDELRRVALLNKAVEAVQLEPNESSRLKVAVELAISAPSTLVPVLDIIVDAKKPDNAARRCAR